MKMRVHIFFWPDSAIQGNNNVIVSKLTNEGVKVNCPPL